MQLQEGEEAIDVVHELLKKVTFFAILCRELNFFQEYGHKTAFYHGSMEPAQRTMIQKQWSKDEINIICATVAFGMGKNYYSSSF